MRDVLSIFISIVAFLGSSDNSAESKGEGDPCRYNAQCTFSNSFCNIVQQTCYCIGGYAYDNTSDSCIPEVIKCNNDKECKGRGWVCKEKTCDCDSGYIKENVHCIKITVGLHEKCNTTNDCSQTTGGKSTQCLHGVCLCEYGYRPTPDKKNCVLQAGLGEKCNTTEECMEAKNDISTECWNGTCSCHAGFRTTPSIRECVRVVIGDRCENNRECYVVNGTRTCDSNVCQCDPSFVPSKKNNNTCLKVAEHNAFCEEDHQCMTENSRCDVPRCVCKKGYKWENSKCVNSQAKLTTSRLWLAPVLFVVSMMWL